MVIPPKYTINAEIVDLIAKIDSLRHYFKQWHYSAKIKQKIVRIGYLKSGLYSARIEGNPLTENKIEHAPESVHSQEIHNILAAINYVEKTQFTLIDISLLLKLHAYVLHDIAADAGLLRYEIGAIFDSFGNAIYVTPPPEKIKPLLSQLFDYLQSDVEAFPLIRAFIAHLIFEKIHPFIDGNGRVGRLLVNAVLKSSNYDFGFFIPYEEYLDNHKSDYYYHIDRGLEHTEAYLIFMLQAFYEQVTKTKQLLDDETDKSNQGLPLLPPRQEELYYIIKDHRMVDVDFLHRRFLKVPKRTINYDLKKLLDAKLIIKIGKTKGSYYAIPNMSESDIIN